MKRIETKILFRCSGLGDLMTNDRSKSNLEKYHDSIEKYHKSIEKLNTAKLKYSESVEKTKELEAEKEIEIPKRKGSKSPKEQYEIAVKKEKELGDKYCIAVDDCEKAEKENIEAEKVKLDIKLSASCRKYLKTMAIEIRYKRKKRMTNKYIKKGIAVENASIELYSEWKGYHLDNNTKRVSNDFLTGETDLEFTDVKGKVNKVTDIKSSYDIDSFEDNRDEDAKKSNYLQLQGYCILHDCNEASVANVLTNNDFTLINDEIRRETYKLKADELEGFDVPSVQVLEIAKDNIFDYDSFIDFLENSPFIDRSELGKLMLGDCEDLEAQEMFNSFVEVDLDDRVIEIEIERSEETEKQIKERVEICRKYLADVYNIHHIS